MQAQKVSMRSGRESSIATIKTTIEQTELSAVQAKGQPILFEAKKENVGLQLESVYRERLQTVHQEVCSVLTQLTLPSPFPPSKNYVHLPSKTYHT